jgi:hypothetical protein
VEWFVGVVIENFINMILEMEITPVHVPTKETFVVVFIFVMAMEIPPFATECYFWLWYLTKIGKEVNTLDAAAHHLEGNAF